MSEKWICGFCGAEMDLPCGFILTWHQEDKKDEGYESETPACESCYWERMENKGE